MMEEGGHELESRGLTRAGSGNDGEVSAIVRTFAPYRVLSLASLTRPEPSKDLWSLALEERDRNELERRRGELL